MYRIVKRAPARLSAQFHDFVTSTFGILGVSGIVFAGILAVLEF
jgi:hypothetical protein